MSWLNNRAVQIRFGVVLVAISGLRLLIEVPDAFDFIVGLCFGVGIALLIAAAARLKIMPEKK